MSRRTWVVLGIVAAVALAAAMVAGLATSGSSEAKNVGFLTAKAGTDSWAEKAGLANEGPELDLRG